MEVEVLAIPRTRDLISGPCLGAKARFLSFNPLNAELNQICHLLTLLGAHHIFHVSGLGVNRTQCRAVTGLLTGHNTLSRYLHILGLLDSPLCGRCGINEETSAHILCECEALASFRHAYLGSFFLAPEDINP